MATIRHKRIQLLQSFTPRLIDPSGEALIITPTSGTININENTQAQLVAKNTVTLQAICTRKNQVINWSTTGGQLSQTTGTSVVLTYSTVPVTDMSDITVTAITSADTKYQPSTLTKTAVINKVVPAQTSVELTLYQRAASAPSVLPSAATYNTSTKTITGTLNGWSTTIPAGTDPLYTTKATVQFYNVQTNQARPVTGWQDSALLVQNGTNGTNGTNGQDATVTLSNMVTAIDAVNGDYIKLNDQSTAYVTGDNQGQGIYFGAGGIYGRNASNQYTFAFDATNGDATFYGKLDVNKEVHFYGNINANGLPVTCWQENTPSSDVAIYGTTSKSGQTAGATVYSSGVQGRVLQGAYSYTAGVAGVNLQQQAYSYAGYFSAGQGGGAIFVNGGGIYLQSGIYTFDINQPQFKTSSGSPLTVDTLNSVAVGARFKGNAPTLILDCIGQQPWYIKHEITNLVLSFNNTNNDLVLNSSGDLTARGNVTAYSDKAIKQHICPISQATGKLKQINGYQYKNLLANKHDCGIIAQEIEKILPELVQVSQTEYEGSKVKTVNYNGVVALLVAANRELIARIEALEAKLK